jgi:hypothetical protein
MTCLEALKPPISFPDIIARAPPKFRARLERVIANGGLLPPKTLKAVVAVLSEMDPTLGTKLNRLSASRDQLIVGLRQCTVAVPPS